MSLKGGGGGGKKEPKSKKRVILFLIDYHVYTRREISFANKSPIVQFKGLKLELIKGPHSKEKMLRGPQFIGEKAYAGRKLLQKLENKLHLFKIHDIVNFLDVRGPHKCIWRATCGPRAACLRPLVQFIKVISLCKGILFIHCNYVFSFQNNVFHKLQGKPTCLLLQHVWISKG